MGHFPSVAGGPSVNRLGTTYPAVPTPNNSSALDMFDDETEEQRLADQLVRAQELSDDVLDAITLVYGNNHWLTALSLVKAFLVLVVLGWAVDLPGGWERYNMIVAAAFCSGQANFLVSLITNALLFPSSVSDWVFHAFTTWGKWLLKKTLMAFTTGVSLLTKAMTRAVRFVMAGGNDKSVQGTTMPAATAGLAVIKPVASMRRKSVQIVSPASTDMAVIGEGKPLLSTVNSFAGVPFVQDDLAASSHLLTDHHSAAGARGVAAVGGSSFAEAPMWSASFCEAVKARPAERGTTANYGSFSNVHDPAFALSTAAIAAAANGGVTADRVGASSSGGRNLATAQDRRLHPGVVLSLPPQDPHNPLVPQQRLDQRGVTSPTVEHDAAALLASSSVPTASHSSGGEVATEGRFARAMAAALVPFDDVGTWLEATTVGLIGGDDLAQVAFRASHFTVYGCLIVPAFLSHCLASVLVLAWFVFIPALVGIVMIAQRLRHYMFDFDDTAASQRPSKWNLVGRAAFARFVTSFLVLWFLQSTVLQAALYYLPQCSHVANEENVTPPSSDVAGGRGIAGNGRPPTNAQRLLRPRAPADVVSRGGHRENATTHGAMGVDAAVVSTAAAATKSHRQSLMAHLREELVDYRCVTPKAYVRELQRCPMCVISAVALGLP